MSERPPAAMALQQRMIADIFPTDVMRRLRAAVDLDPDRVLASYVDDDGRLKDVEILITGWGAPAIDADALAALPKLRAVIHSAGTVKALVGPDVFARGIAVSSAAQANAVPVAEYTIAALVFGAKQVSSRVQAYRAGSYRPGYLPGERIGLYGTTIGIIGASRVGRLVIERLRTFDTEVLLADPYADAATARALGVQLVDLDELCRRSDLVSVHAPALPETHHLLDARRLALLRDGTVLVNTARGSLVDTAALTAECRSGRLSAVLDVTDPEPLPAGHPLHELPNVLVTPHLAGASGRDLRRLGEYATAEVERVVRGEPLHGLVREGDLGRIA